MNAEIHRPNDLLLDLVRPTEDVSIVLCEASQPQQAMQDAAALVPVDGAQFGHAHGQIAIAAHRRLVYLDVEGAVHGPDEVLLAVDVHGRVHILAIEVEVAAHIP